MQKGFHREISNDGTVQLDVNSEGTRSPQCTSAAFDEWVLLKNEASTKTPGRRAETEGIEENSHKEKEEGRRKQGEPSLR